jgi:hypothetical protein
MKRITLIIACFLLLNIPGISNAQSSESKPINKDYAALDLNGIRAVAPLRAPELYGFESFPRNLKKFQRTVLGRTKRIWGSARAESN